ncbi:unnamed protein product, partial [Larinioides sclopetarius]
MKTSNSMLYLKILYHEELSIILLASLWRYLDGFRNIWLWQTLFW